MVTTLVNGKLIENARRRQARPSPDALAAGARLVRFARLQQLVVFRGVD